jgi:CubicO group peptidase (beta-lactamase class C family)
MTAAFERTGLDRWRAALDRHVDSGSVPGLVALAWRHGELHLHTAGTRTASGTDAMTPDTLFRIASMTKPIAAAAAMILVEEGRLALDEPVDALLPELANRRVLRRIDGPVDETVPADRPITTRDLLTLRMGLGYLFTPEVYPIHTLLDPLPILKGPPHPQALPDPDAWMAIVGSLPLMYQPGSAWLYDIGLDVLGVLIRRAAGQPLDQFMEERIFAPLAMYDTGFYVPAAKRSRLATAHAWNSATGAFDIYDGVEDSAWGTPPAFPAAASGLVSTAQDYFAFCRMLLHEGDGLLRPESVHAMTTGQITPAQREASRLFLGDYSSWGFGMAVDIATGPPAHVPGRFGWDGGLGTTSRTDPANGLIGILLTQRNMDSPEPPAVFTDFWSALHGAISP